MRKASKLQRGDHADLTGLQYTRRVPTPDDWHPTAEDGTVRVRVENTTRVWGTPALRVSVWGLDDTGMERDEHFDRAEDAAAAFRRRVREVNGWALVTMTMLRELGFTRA